MDQFNLTNMNEPSDNQNQPTPAVVTPLKCRFEKADEMESWFSERADRWEREAGIHSSPGARLLHKDYISILTRGADVAPFIFKRLKKTRKDWCWALERIFDPENPAEGMNSYDEAVNAWLKWGSDRHLI
jgi:hypothetical protein